MDEIQKELIKAGRKDLAQQYYLKVARKPLPKYKVDDKIEMVPADSTLYSNPNIIRPGDTGVVVKVLNGDEYHVKIDRNNKIQLIHADFFKKAAQTHKKVALIIDTYQFRNANDAKKFKEKIEKEGWAKEITINYDKVSLQPLAKAYSNETSSIQTLSYNMGGKPVHKVIGSEKVAQEKKFDFRDYIKNYNFQLFTASDWEQQTFGALIVNFYKDYFQTVNPEKATDINIMHEVDAILKNIRKGAKNQVRNLVK